MTERGERERVWVKVEGKRMSKTLMKAQSVGNFSFGILFSSTKQFHSKFGAHVFRPKWNVDTSIYCVYSCECQLIHSLSLAFSVRVMLLCWWVRSVCWTNWSEGLFIHTFSPHIIVQRRQCKYPSTRHICQYNACVLIMNLFCIFEIKVCWSASFVKTRNSSTI